MKLHKCVYFILVLIILAILCCGCKVSNRYKRSIFSNNSKIAEVEDRYYLNKASFNTEDKNTTIKFVEFIGMRTIWLVSAREDAKLTVNYKSKIEEGKFKVVYVSSDKIVTDIFKGESSGEYTIEVPKGKGRIKIIGSDTKGSIDMSLNIEGSITVTKPE